MRENLPLDQHDNMPGETEYDVHVMLDQKDREFRRQARDGIEHQANF